jgi:DNA (cytosine-5)-methyltransferase 1
MPEVIKEDLVTTFDENDIGYNVVYRVLNASDYGVPQNRQRVIFVGVRKDLNITFTFPNEQKTK